MEKHEIYFVRHGQPQWQLDGGAVDEPCLTELGRKQAECTAERLSHLPVTHLIVSDLLRARQTAEPLARLVGVEPRICPWFREIQGKKLQGSDSESVDAYYTNWRHTSLRERENGPQGGESLESVRRRLSTGLDALLLELGFNYINDGRWQCWSVPSEPRCVVFVGHTYASGLALGHLMGWELSNFMPEQMRLSWGAFSRVAPFAMGSGYVWRVREVDVHDHLGELAADDS